MSLIASPAGSVTTGLLHFCASSTDSRRWANSWALVKCCKHLTSWNWIEGELIPSINWFLMTSWCCSAVQLGYALSASIHSSTGNSTSGSIKIATPAHFHGYKSLLQTVTYLLIISWTQEPKLAHCMFWTVHPPTLEAVPLSRNQASFAYSSKCTDQRVKSAPAAYHATRQLET